ncbi:formylglycine-generating enzyme family protein [Candidatus Magnetaquicoccus inordinatus]|uniref:formylglycine-generating enzyme family protein n=1 Tax=Candidatus Magnetaquicoccus inordinatus TaxID=2496818 RepID=UPI001D0EB3BA|nr:formylglycine-generating enzyme family protein [Candidatus Magnetaquicoccus inordinatus]
MSNSEPIVPMAGSGYADLLCALHYGQSETLDAMAWLLGFVKLPEKQVQETTGRSAASSKAVAVSAVTPVQQESTDYPKNIQDIAFWVPDYFQARESLQLAVKEKKEVADTLPANRPATRLLTPWSRLLPKMRQRFSELAASREADIDKIVQRFLQSRALDPLPLRQHRRWGRGVQLILDRSEHLIPLQEDLDQVAMRLAGLFGPQAVEYALLLDPRQGPQLSTLSGTCQKYRLPEPGTLVVVLGDLGQLAPHSAELQRYWQQLGEALRRRGCRAMALTPVPFSRCQPERLPAWKMLPLAGEQRRRRAEARQLTAQAERLLRLLSPAIRIEPGLLRAVRLLMGAAADAGTEIDAWNHPLMAGRSRVAGVLDPQELPRLRADFAQLEPLSLQQKVVQTIRDWRAGLSPEVWYEELLHLSEQQLPETIRQRDLLAAQNFFKTLPSKLKQESRVTMLSWFRRVVSRSLPEFLHSGDEELQVALQTLYREACADNLEQEFVQGMDLRLLPIDHEQPINLYLGQSGGELIASAEKPIGSSLGILRSRQNRLQYGERLQDRLPDNLPAFWRSGQAPSWADKWGEDEYGPWVEFVVKGVRQRMRWIPAGSFLMGSHEEEHGRDSNEGPQHKVTLANGFWMWSTTCTQALWQAVMGRNPSLFRGASLPVEQVSFQDVQKFLQQIEKILPGISLTLPNEAQWEYACRAGSMTPFSFGSTISTAEVNFDGRNPYLPQDAQGEYRARTVPAGSLPANPWGLHEMHGNLWEWCQDAWHKSYAGAPNDGSSWEDQADASRVLRGGSWNDFARFVRAACRNGNESSDRFGDIGFRCARVQPVSPAGKQESAEPQFGRAGRSGSALLELQHASAQGVAHLPVGEQLQMQSDVERLTLFRRFKPAWTSAIGRDHFGLWAELQLGQVRQRLRWIPPGRFLMGSSEQEPGRFDNEAPQHEVTISSGFWIFDTPCTQALWQEVMGKNPSEFKSADRPVEQVSFKDVQQFLQKLDKRVPALALTLPSEAQWEYACRAGSSTALYSGAIKILGENNAPALDTIAWYGGNSGREFDLTNGWDTNKWPEKQYPADKKAGTHRVGLKLANSWGLYDMLGNVWEWCQDGWHNTYEGAPADGSAWKGKADASRVLRGGSWVSYARYLRVACRDSSKSSNGISYIGFRCVRAQW